MVEEALELGQEILDMIEEMDDDTKDRGCDFFVSVEEKVTDMLNTIEENDRCSDGQMTALENMRDGVARWIRD